MDMMDKQVHSVFRLGEGMHRLVKLRLGILELVKRECDVGQREDWLALYQILRRLSRILNVLYDAYEGRLCGTELRLMGSSRPARPNCPLM